jgi:CRISP-associated protein Cas1
MRFEKVLSIPLGMEEMGISKGWLNQMKKNAESDKPFTLNKHVRERLDPWEQTVDATI